jgi:hypothetical protein
VSSPSGLEVDGNSSLLPTTTRTLPHWGQGTPNLSIKFPSGNRSLRNLEFRPRMPATFAMSSRLGSGQLSEDLKKFSRSEGSTHFAVQKAIIKEDGFEFLASNYFQGSIIRLTYPHRARKGPERTSLA